jgi:membrane fusion protein (multidrug efflux system)
MSQKKWIGLGIIIVVVAGLAVAGYLHWHHGKIYPSTDNAYTHGDVYPVASRVQGTVSEAPIEDDQWVERAQLIAHLDPRDFEQAVAEAEADLAKAQAALELVGAQIAAAESQVAVARSQAALASSDRQRYSQLQQQGSVAERQYEQATTSASVADDQVTAAQKQVQALQAERERDKKEVARMQARLDLARLRLSYTTITAPAAGVVADKSVQPGQVVVPGQPLCRVAALLPGHVWIEANFKETQLGRIRVGQPATVTVDAHGGREYHGKVASLNAGTGAAFSLLPPQNATGNWVKIVQRLPVRIDLDLTEEAARGLKLGYSCHVTVDTSGLEEGR